MAWRAVGTFNGTYWWFISYCETHFHQTVERIIEHHRLSARPKTVLVAPALERRWSSKIPPSPLIATIIVKPICEHVWGHVKNSYGSLSDGGSHEQLSCSKCLKTVWSELPD